MNLNDVEKKVLLLISSGCETFNSIHKYGKIPKSTLYYTLKVLERLNLITKRNRKYSLTKEGKALVEEIKKERHLRLIYEYNRLRNIVLSSFDFSPEVKEEISNLIDRIIELIEKEG